MRTGNLHCVLYWIIFYKIPTKIRLCINTLSSDKEADVIICDIWGILTVIQNAGCSQSISIPCNSAAVPWCPASKGPQFWHSYFWKSASILYVNAIVAVIADYSDIWVLYFKRKLCSGFPRTLMSNLRNSTILLASVQQLTAEGFITSVTLWWSQISISSWWEVFI